MAYEKDCVLYLIKSRVYILNLELSCTLCDGSEIIIDPSVEFLSLILLESGEFSGL
jgi:hypothetical protein